MHEMIERVARALCKVDGHDPDYVKLDFETGGRMGGIMLPNRHLRWAEYVEKARVTIVALHEPTEKMIDRGLREIRWHDCTTDGVDDVNDTRNAWHAMVDEAAK